MFGSSENKRLKRIIGKYHLSYKYTQTDCDKQLTLATGLNALHLPLFNSHQLQNQEMHSIVSNIFLFLSANCNQSINTFWHTRIQLNCSWNVQCTICRMLNRLMPLRTSIQMMVHSILLKIFLYIKSRRSIETVW